MTDFSREKKPEIVHDFVDGEVYESYVSKVEVIGATFLLM
jgi:hypothetical protein